MTVLTEQAWTARSIRTAAALVLWADDNKRNEQQNKK